MMKGTLTAPLLLFAVIAAVPAVADDAGLLPADGAIPGWTRSAGVRTFQQADLYGHINGGAELFLELGFEQLTLQRYKNGTEEIAVEIYRMTDQVAAAGIYLMKCGKETPDKRLAARHTVNRYQLQLQRDRYYVAINSGSGSEAQVPAMLQFAGSITGRLPADSPPKVLALLPRKGLVAGSERIIRGQYGLQALFTLGDGDMLQLGGKLTAVGADYRDEGTGTYTLIAAEYPDAAAARSAFAHISGNLDRYIQVVGKSDARLVLRDFANKYASVSLAGNRIDIKVNLEQRPPG
jgi:hypothetical protein